MIVSSELRMNLSLSNKTIDQNKIQSKFELTWVPFCCAFWLSEIIKATIELYFWNTIYAIIFPTCSAKPSFSRAINMSLRWITWTFITDISCSVPSSNATIGGHHHHMAFRTTWSIWSLSMKRTHWKTCLISSKVKFNHNTLKEKLNSYPL